jgi:hypothetical protein
VADYVGALLTIYFFEGSLKKDAPLSRADLRIWSKIRAILRWSKFVSAYVERDKKILKNFIFAFAPCANDRAGRRRQKSGVRKQKSERVSG